MNPIPSIYSNGFKMYYIYQLKLRIKNCLNKVRGLNEKEGAG